MSHNGSYDSPNAGLRLLSAAISPHIRGMSANQMIGSDKLVLSDKLVETGSNWSNQDSKLVGKRRLFESEKLDRNEECRNLEQLVEMVNT